MATTEIYPYWHTLSLLDVLPISHVVELAARDPEHVVIGIVPSAGDKTFRGRVVAYDPARDLAEIAFDGAALPPVTLYNGPLSDGAQVVALGYPGHVDLATAQSALGYITQVGRASLRERVW